MPGLDAKPAYYKVREESGSGISKGSGGCCDTMKAAAVPLHPFLPFQPSSTEGNEPGQARMCSHLTPPGLCSGAATAGNDQLWQHRGRCRRCWGQGLAADLSTRSWPRIPGTNTSREFKHIKAKRRFSSGETWTSLISLELDITSWNRHTICPRRSSLTIKSEKTSSNKCS